jgi:dynactin-6
MSSSTKRSSAAKVAGPKPPVHFSSSITISEKAVLQGTHSITIQSETVVHPAAKFESTMGSVLVGRRCIIHERAHIGASAEDPNVAKPGGVSLGDYVIVEVDAVIEAGDTEIGDGALIQVGSRVGAGAKVGKVLDRSTVFLEAATDKQQNCTLTPKSVLKPGEVLPDDTVIYANGLRRTDRRGLTDLRKTGSTKQIAILRKMMPSNPAKFQS